MPVVEDVEQKQEESNEAEGLDGEEQVTVTSAVTLGREDDSNQPQVREDEVEQKNVSWVGGEEESDQEEGDGENGLQLLAAAREDTKRRILTMTSM